MTLYGYCQHVLKPQQLMDAMGKMRQVSARMSLSPETKRSLRDYLDSLKNHIAKISQVYREWFLDRDLEIIRKLHEPGHWLKARFSYSEELVKTCTRLATMELYRTDQRTGLLAPVAGHPGIGRPGSAGRGKATGGGPGKLP